MTQTARRRSRGSAWRWKQTDAWYYTPPGTKRRVALRDEDGKLIRGEHNRKLAELALARVKLSGDWRPMSEGANQAGWLVASACSKYILHCQASAARGAMSQGYRDEVIRYLNELSAYCGALPVAELRNGHVLHWIEIHPTWRSPATQRNAIAIVLAAFNYVQSQYNVGNPLRGLKKPASQPRLHSLTSEEEAVIYEATDEPFADFLFAAINTGLRPFCELARLTAEEVEETERGMMWRINSSKTKKTRKIPVRSKVAELTRRLMADAANGSEAALFRNSKGRPWKKVTGVQRFLRIKRKLGWDVDPLRKRYSSYSCRHTFAHRMLAGYWTGGVGCSIETLAELMGDTPKVAYDHYGREWGQHFQEPLWAAIGVPANSAVSSSKRSRRKRQ